MRHVGLFAAKQKLSELVDRAGKGERIAITRRGKPAALLVSVSAPTNLKEIFAGIERIRKQARLKSGASAKRLIEEGRI